VTTVEYCRRYIPRPFRQLRTHEQVLARMMYVEQVVEAPEHFADARITQPWVIRRREAA